MVRPSKSPGANKPIAEPGAPVAPDAAAQLDTLKTLPDSDLVDYASKLPAQKAPKKSIFSALATSIVPKSHAPASKASAALQEHLGGALDTLTKIYADGRITAGEVEALERARGSIAAILALRDDAALESLPKGVRERIEKRLFLPLETLQSATASQHVALEAAGIAQAVDTPANVETTLIRAGGAETKTVESTAGATGSGAIFTSRGPTKAAQGISYKSYNEDAGVVGVIPADPVHFKSEILFAGAFDQAGGMGQIPGQTGAASAIAAKTFEAAMHTLDGDADARLRATALKAHAQIVALNTDFGVESITTMAAGFMRDGELHAVNVGDSKVLHFSSDGALKNETVAHNQGDEIAAATGNPNAGLGVSNIVTSSLGPLDYKPKIDVYTWPVAKGDYLVFVSDGIADANLEAQRTAASTKSPWKRINGDVTNDQIGAIVAKSTSATTAARSIKDYALSQMAAELGKPDNITAVVLQVS